MSRFHISCVLGWYVAWTMDTLLWTSAPTLGNRTSLVSVKGITIELTRYTSRRLQMSRLRIPSCTLYLYNVHRKIIYRNRVQTIGINPS